MSYNRPSTESNGRNRAVKKSNRQTVKKTLFHAIALTMSLAVGLVIGEFLVRVRDERGLRGAIGTLQSRVVPFSETSDRMKMIADAVLGFRYDPDYEGVNSLGILDKEFALDKPEGQSRIIILGDSVSVLVDWGYEPDKLFAATLKKAYEGRAEVINAAIPGFTAYQERLLFERVLLPYHPDLVILQYTLNDNGKFLHRLDKTIGFLYTEEARRVYLPEEGDPLAWLPNWSYLAVRLRFLVMEWRRGAYEYPWQKYPGFALAWRDDGWGTFEDQLVAIKNLTASKGGQLMVLMIPFRPQLEENFLVRDRAYVLKPQKIMASLCDKYGIPLLDVFDDMEKGGGTKLYYDLAHLNSKGHQVVGDALLHHLAGNKIFQSRRPDAVPASALNSATD